jgi:hypothetical protein
VLSSVVVLPSAAAGKGPVDAAVTLLDDVDRGAQLLVDGDGLGRTALFSQVTSWPQADKRNRAQRVLRRLAATGRIVPVPAPASASGCSEACDALRSVAARTLPDVTVYGEPCRAEVASPAIQIDEYVGSNVQDVIRSDSMRFSRSRTTEDELDSRVLKPLLQYAQSATVFDRQIGRSLQEDLASYSRAEVRDGFDLSIRFLLEVYTRSSRLRDRSVRIITGLWTDKERPFRDAYLRLEQWCERLGTDYPVIPVKLDVRAESRARQLEHDRYLLTNQVTANVTRGFDLLFTDRQMQNAGLDPLRDARPIHTTTVTLGPPDADILIEADQLDPAQEYL